MNWQSHQILAVINLVLCAGIAWASLCRLNSEICKRHKWARLRYTILMAGALGLGFERALWGSWPTIGSVILAGSVLAGLTINMFRWHGLSGHPMRRKGDA